jgi:hypothetical protein
MVLVAEAALHHTGKASRRFPIPSTWHHRTVKLRRMADNYTVLMPYFTRQHDVEPQDI